MMEFVFLLFAAMLLIPVLLLVGFAIAGGTRLMTARRFVASAVQAEAVVVGLPSRMRRVSGGSGVSVPVRYFEPVVRFQTPQGELVEARVEVGTPTPSAAIGQTTPVLYNPLRPQQVRLAEADGRFNATGPVIVGCLSAMLLAGMLLCVGLMLLSALSSPS
jgi:hypothetical protein